jgi:hypothetical protein
MQFCKPDPSPAHVLHVSFFRGDAVIAIGWTDSELRTKSKTRLGKFVRYTDATGLQLNMTDSTVWRLENWANCHDPQVYP